MLTKGFPESYIPYLTALHEEHPFWQFEPILVTEMQPTYTFEYIISREDTPGPNPSNLVTTDSWAPQPWTSLGQANYTPYYDESDTALYDSGWRKASNAAVRYFMDPRNFLNDVDIFMFEDLSFFNAETQTVELVNDALASSFMGNYAMCDNGITYAQHLYNCAKTYNVNAITLANRLVLEQGLGTSPLVNGTLGTTLAGYYAAREENADDDRIWGDYTPEDVFDEEELLSFDGYYNFFNTGASGNGYFAIYYNAAQESIENGWDTKAKAIEGGAAKLALNMIQDYQYTIYLQKFNVDPRSDSNFWGQYMQNISAPLTEGRNARATYKNGGVLERGYTFRIPVYDGLPETASADPANGNSRYSSSVSTGADWGTQTYSLTASVAEGQGTVHFGSGETSSQILPGTTVNVQVTPAANYAVSQVLIGGKRNPS
ncbi:MAG: hypothetical protein UHS49_03925 [Faecalimonas sp.]|nr:hypothetical protein [Faecalimonas sp.]